MFFFFFVFNKFIIKLITLLVMITTDYMINVYKLIVTRNNLMKGSKLSNFKLGDQMFHRKIKIVNLSN